MKFLSFAACALALLSSAAAAQDPKPQAPGPKSLPEVAALLKVGKDLSKARKYENAIKADNVALAKAQELKDAMGQGEAWASIGLANYYKGNLAKALEGFENARGFYEQAGSKRETIGMMMDIGVINDNTGHPDKAIVLYQQALKLNREIGATNDVAKTLLNIAILYSNQDNPTLALDYAQQARAAFHEAKDLEWELSTFVTIGGSYSAMGQRQKAIDTFKELIRRSAGTNFLYAQGNAYGNLGAEYSDSGDVLQALDCYRHSMQFYTDAHDVREMGKTYVEIGIANDRMGQSALAVDNIQKGLAIGRQTGDRHLVEQALDNLGVVLEQDAQYDKARPFLLEVLPLDREMHNSSGLCSALHTLGGIELQEKHYAQSLDYFRQALAVAVQLANLDFQATTIESIADVYAEQGKPASAIPEYLKALAMYRAVDDKPLAANTLGNMAKAEAKLGRTKDAEAHYRESVHEFEAFRTRLGGYSEAKEGFLGTKIEVYRRFIALLAQRRQTEEAFDLVQKTKGRVLLDLMAGGKVSINQELSPQERAEEARLKGEAESLNARIVNEGVQNKVGGKKRSEALKLQEKQAETKISEFTTNLYLKHPDLARKRTATTLTLAKVGPDLPSDTALLEYVSGEDSTVLFVVTSRRHVATAASYSLGLGSSSLSKECVAFRDACADPKGEYSGLSRSLFNQLISPAAKQLSGKRRLLICPDGPLWNVPFAALTSSKGFLASRYEIDYAYSATGHDATWKHKKSSAKKSMLVLANPDLGGAARFGDNPLIPGQRPIEPASRPIEPASRPIEPASRPIEPASRDLSAELSRGGVVELPGTAREAAAIAEIFPDATVLTREKAQESAFKQLAGGYRYLHIASHAFFNDAAPMLSSIVLSKPTDAKDDGYLTAREIFDMKLNADLVVLSACNTARGETTSGEGVVGMSWALFAAGAPAQVISQWSVDDQATADLMTRFYRNKKAGEGSGTALRHAELSLGKANAKWRHPYYWAPFVLLGDWR